MNKKLKMYIIIALTGIAMVGIGFGIMKISESVPYINEGFLFINPLGNLVKDIYMYGGFVLFLAGFIILIVETSVITRPNSLSDNSGDDES